jgi:hypothetical protein
MVVTALDIFSGNDKGEFSPKATFTRGAAATLLAKAYNTPTEWAKLGNVYVSPFVDHSTKFGNGDGWAYAMGFMTGTSNIGPTFSPDKDITVLGWTGLLVKMLGYELSNDWTYAQTDIIRYAAEARLFDGINVSEPNVAITYEQAAQILVNAMTANRVTSDVNTYTGQKINTYTTNRTALLATKELELANNASGGAPKYYYSYAKLTNTQFESAHDAFGYPGTALIATGRGASAFAEGSGKYIAGFVPHYENLGSFTAGLNDPAYPYAGYPAKIIGSTTFSLDFNDVVLNGDNEAAKSIAFTGVAPTNADKFVLGTYVNVVSYVDSNGETKYKTISIFEDLVNNTLGGTTAIESLLDLTVVPKSTIVTTAVGAYSVGAKKASSGNYLYLNDAAPKSVTVTSQVRTLRRVTYTVDSVSATAFVWYDKNAVDVGSVEMTSLEGKVQLIEGSHGVVFNPATIIDKSWSATTAKYLYVVTGTSGSNLYKTPTTGATVDVIYDDGTKGNITQLTTEAINGNGKRNVTKPAVAGTFYEYITTGGTTALFAIGGNTSSIAAAVSTNTSQPYAGTVPTARSDIGNLTLTPNAIHDPIFASDTTTFVQVVYPSAPPATEKQPLKNVGTGWDKVIYPLAVNQLNILALSTIDLFGTKATVKEFIIHKEEFAGAVTWDGIQRSPDWAGLITLVTTLPETDGSVTYVINPTTANPDGVAKIQFVSGKTAADYAAATAPYAYLASGVVAAAPAAGDYAYVVGDTLNYINKNTIVKSSAPANTNIKPNRFILDAAGYSATTTYVELLYRNDNTEFYPAIYASSTLAGSAQVYAYGDPTHPDFKGTSSTPTKTAAEMLELVKATDIVGATAVYTYADAQFVTDYKVDEGGFYDWTPVAGFYYWLLTIPSEDYPVKATVPLALTKITSGTSGSISGPTVGTASFDATSAELEYIAFDSTYSLTTCPYLSYLAPATLASGENTVSILPAQAFAFTAQIVSIYIRTPASSGYAESAWVDSGATVTFAA